jgi:hypothetical protein
MPDTLLIPYSELGFGAARPYLFLRVTGLDGHGRMIPGLIDSGARQHRPAGRLRAADGLHQQAVKRPKRYAATGGS